MPAAHTTRAARRSAADDRPEHRHPVGHGQRLFLVVGDQQRGGAETPLQGANLVAQIGAHIGVQGRERLVQQQGAGIDGQRARQRDTLLLAPDSWVTARAACSARPTSSSSSRARRCAARHRPCAAPCRRPRCPPPTDAETRHSSGTPCRCRAGAPACPPDPVHSAGCCPHARSPGRPPASRVDFPEPLGPITASSSPVSTCIEMPCTPCRAPG